MDNYEFVDALGTMCLKRAAELGNGSFGSTYHIREKLSGRVVAVKFVKANTPGELDAVQAELTNLYSVNHENVVRGHNCFQYEDPHDGERYCCIVMELCSGGTLGSAITAAPFAETQVIAWMKQLLEGLAYLHSENKVHRDLQSDNVLLGEGGVLKIADVGLMTACSNTASYVSRQGHYAYHAPECFASSAGDPMTSKSDIWAVGCICSEMVTREMLYADPGIRGGNMGATLGSITQHEGGRKVRELIQRMRSICAQDSPLPDLVEGMLQTARGSRPSAAEALSVINALVAATDGGEQQQDEQHDEQHDEQQDEQENREETGPEDPRTCMICMVEPRQAVFMPCNHCAACVGCAAILVARRDPCPVCRGTIEISPQPARTNQATFDPRRPVTRGTETVHQPFWGAGAYEGGLVDGKAHGKGKATWPGKGVYDGEWVEDKFHGKGKITAADGRVYEGDWVEGKKHGKGKLTKADGNVYEGDWVEAKFHGKGKATWADGNVYEGDWVENKRHGKGKETKANGDVYEGDWVEDKFHGKGKETWADGTVYEGDWVEGEKHGKGKMTWADGNVYEGDWVEDKRHGKGKWSSVDGTWYEGDWVEDKRHGMGKMGSCSGAGYEGEWVEDKRHGMGKMGSCSGAGYEGEWVNNEPRQQQLCNVM